MRAPGRQALHPAARGRLGTRRVSQSAVFLSPAGYGAANRFEPAKCRRVKRDAARRY